MHMCTRSYNGEWHINNLLISDEYSRTSGFYYAEDSLQISNNPLKWIWFEYLGDICVKYLAVSCGPLTVDDVPSKGTNFVIGADVLEQWYLNQGLRGVRRCGIDNDGVRLDGDVEVSFIIHRNAFRCGEDDKRCIANNVAFDNSFINCHD